MAENADSVVVELIAKNDQFDAATKSSATGFAQSMGTIQSAGAAAEKGVDQFSSALKSNRLAMNNSRIGMMEFQHIARGVSDQMAAGAPLTQVLGQHMAMLGEAVALSGGAFGKLGAFLQGPWGIALTLATTLAIGLASKHKEAGDAADKHRTAEETLTAYIDGERIATDVLLQSLIKLNDQENKSLETTNQAIRARYDLAHATLAQAEANKAVLQTQLAGAQAALEQAKSTTFGAAGGAGAGAAVDVYSRQITSIQGQLAEMDKAIGQATALIDTEFTKLARNLSTHVGRANDEFDRQLAALEAKYRGTEVRKGSQTTLVGGLLNQPGVNDARRSALQQQLIDAEEKLGVTRAKAVAAAQQLDDAEKGVAKSTEQFGKQISFADAAAIAASAGLKVTSGYRSTTKQAELYRTVRTAENPVAKPGTSAHEGVNGKWALDIAFAPGITPASLKKLYGDQGVTLSAVYKETGHYHIEGSRSQAAAAEGAAQRAAEKAEREAKAAAQKAAEEQAAYDGELNRLRGEFLAARKSQVKGELEQLEIQRSEVLAEERKRDEGYRSAVTLGKLSQAHANQLIAAEASVAGEKLKAIAIDEQVARIRQADDAAERASQYRIDDLRSAEQAATSQQARREIDLQILDILYQEKEAHLQRLKLIAENNHDQARANDLQAQIDQLPQQKANDVQGTLRGTMDPLASWLHSIPHDAAAVEEALQGIAINGFDTIASSIAGVVTGTETLGQAFGNLAKQVVNDLVQMTVRMLIFRALSSVIGGGGLGKSIFPVSNGVDPLAPLPARASGGPVSGGRAYLVGEQGPELFVPGSSGGIVPNNSLAASSWAGGQSIVVLHVEANDYFDARVAEVSGPIAAQAGTRGAYAGAGIARNGLARRQLHQLGSRG